MHLFQNIPNLKQLQALSPGFEALFWDMDGTILESEQIHASSTLETIKNLNGGFELDFEKLEEVCTGQTDQFIFEYLQGQGCLTQTKLDDFIQAKNLKIKEALDTVSMDTIFSPAVKQLMEEISQTGIKQAVVTSSEKVVAHLILGHLQIHNYFEFVITREDTQENKPSPAPYLAAMRKLNLAEEKVIIFEDSSAGLAAATAAKAFVCQAAWY